MCHGDVLKPLKETLCTYYQPDHPDASRNKKAKYSHSVTTRNGQKWPKLGILFKLTKNNFAIKSIRKLKLSAMLMMGCI